MKKYKNKQKYLKMKRLKEVAKEKEHSRKIDYSDSPIREKPKYVFQDGSYDFIESITILGKIEQAKRMRKMFVKPENK